VPSAALASTGTRASRRKLVGSLAAAKPSTKRAPPDQDRLRRGRHDLAPGDDGGRALQAAPQKAWSGRSENVAAAQRAFSHRARMNGLATRGEWKADLEKKAA